MCKYKHKILSKRNMKKKKTHGAYCIACNMMLIQWLSVKKYGHPEEEEDEVE